MKETRTRRINRRRHVRWDRIILVLAIIVGLIVTIKHFAGKRTEIAAKADHADTSASEYFREAIAPDTEVAKSDENAASYALLSGADISKHNGEIVTDGDFVIVKATEGVGYVDPRFEENIQNAISNGQLAGVYHYARPDTGNMPTVEAEHFVETIKPYLGKIMIVLDWEQPGTVDQTDWAASWLWEVYSMTGVKPVIYMSSSVAADPHYDWSGDDYSVAKNFPLWVADYTTDDGGNHVISYDVSKHGWETIMWQYTGDGVDRSWSKLTAEDWESACAPTALALRLSVD